jgi:hypothetical protein
MAADARRSIGSDAADSFYRKSLPNRYPIAKKTKITTATITATIAIMLRTEGDSSFTAWLP